MSGQGRGGEGRGAAVIPRSVCGFCLPQAQELFLWFVRIPEYTYLVSSYLFGVLDTHKFKWHIAGILTSYLPVLTPNNLTTR